MSARNWILFGLALAACPTTRVEAVQLQLSAGAEFSNGKYDQGDSTRTFVVPFSARVSMGNLSFRASIPYVSVRGPADVTVVVDGSAGSGGGSDSSGSGSSGGGSTNSGSGSSGSGSSGTSGGTLITDSGSVVVLFPVNRAESGLGDASLSLTYSFNDIGSTRFYADLTARAVLPTGDEIKGLGNGTTDYAAVTEIGWAGTNGGLYVGGGRRFLEAILAINRVDGWQANAGFWRNTGKKTVVGMQANWREAATVGGVDPASIDAYLTRRLSSGWKLEISGGAGLTNANADFVFGLNFIWRAINQRR